MQKLWPQIVCPKQPPGISRSPFKHTMWADGAIFLPYETNRDQFDGQAEFLGRVGDW